MFSAAFWAPSMHTAEPAPKPRWALAAGGTPSLPLLLPAATTSSRPSCALVQVSGR